jgi:predicted GNAT family acetyltransferase
MPVRAEAFIPHGHFSDRPRSRDHVGHLSYLRSEGQIQFASTVVDPAHRGQGLAAQLVEHAVQDARDEGVRITTGCWYVEDWLAAHPG